MGAVVLAAHVLTLRPYPYSHCFHDELQYVQAARDIAEGRIPRYNRGREAKYPPLYPAILAPAWALSSREDFPWRARAVNALLLASTLWPAYRIARRLLGRGTAVCAAGLAILAPWQGLGRQLLSESLAIPLFLAFALVTIRLAERPGVRRGAWCGALLGALALTKTLFLVVAAPLAAALLWAWRPRRAGSLAALAATGVAAAAVFLPWQLRGRLFPSERDVPRYYSYADEFLSNPPATLGNHLDMVREHALAPLIALGAPFLALALAGLGRRLRASSPEERALGVLTLGSLLALLGLASVWAAQCRLDHAMERYALPLWPLLTLVAVGELWRGLPGWPALGVTVLLALAAPDHALVPEGSANWQFDALSYCQAAWLTGLTGSPLATRAILLAPLLLLIPRARGYRWGAALLLVGSALWTGNGLARFNAVRVVWDEINEREREPVWRWLDRWVRPRDTLVHHSACAGLAYPDALRYESDYCMLDFRLLHDGDSNARFDFDAFRFVFPFAEPRGSIWLLTPHDLFEQVPAWPVVDRFGRYRLHRLPPPGTPEGGWPGGTAPSHEAGNLSATTREHGTGCGGPKPPRLEGDPPRLGRPQTLRILDAAPRAPVRLLVGAGAPTPLPLGPCTLQVRLGHAATLSLGRTDEQGVWSFTLELPEVPALAGLDVTLQAFIEVVGGPVLGRLQVTNAVHQRFGL